MNVVEAKVRSIVSASQAVATAQCCCRDEYIKLRPLYRRISLFPKDLDRLPVWRLQSDLSSSYHSLPRPPSESIATAFTTIGDQAYRAHTVQVCICLRELQLNDSKAGLLRTGKTQASENGNNGTGLEVFA